MDSIDLHGFDPIVQDQLARISQERRSFRRDLSAQQQQPQPHPQPQPQPQPRPFNQNQHDTYIHPRNMGYTQDRPNRGFTAPQMGPDPDAFPPLGSSRPAPQVNPTPYVYIHDQDLAPTQSSMFTHDSQGAPRSAQEFFNRTRGRGRGRGPRRDHHRSSLAANHDHGRPTSQRNHNPYNSNPSQSFGRPDYQRASRHRSNDQADYLDYLAHKSMTNMLKHDEIEKKHLFRQHLEGLARDVLSESASSEPDARSTRLKLQSYGSLSNSFGTSGCDVDLLLTIERKAGDYLDVTETYKRDLEKALLDHGIGARLLTNTRVPIIRVCETPSPELLKNLRENRRQRESAETLTQLASNESDTFAPLPDLTESQLEGQMAALAELDLDAAEVPLPQTPVVDQAKLEYFDDCGIQCDINFTNHVALYNSKLLWTYGQCDTRVRHMGIFIKNWAKARNINTPYHGTLSSYGYILMVLHYLMNIAHPPVIPNLQQMAYQNAWGKRSTATFEGYDIRFTNDPARIREVMGSMPKNHKTLGGLLHGFFRYYTARDGFNWTQDVISIRTAGGILHKQAKGWTGARWTGIKQNIRLRYLLAIEDPFEIDHNIARTVGHNGIKAIRDEFRRSWSMIETAQRASEPQNPSMIWVCTDQSSGSSVDGFSFLEPRGDRGDLLKKDTEFRREQLRLLKQKMEADEELAKAQTLLGGSDDGIECSYGRSAGEDALFEIDALAEDQAKLIHDVQRQDEKISRMRGPRTTYRRLPDDDDDDDGDNDEGEGYIYNNKTTSSGWQLESKHVPDTPQSSNNFAAENLLRSSEIHPDDWATASETPSRSDANVTRYSQASSVSGKAIDQDRWNNEIQSDISFRESEYQRNWSHANRGSSDNHWHDTLSPPRPNWMRPSSVVERDRVMTGASTRNFKKFGKAYPSSQKTNSQWQTGARSRDSERVGRFIQWSSNTVGGRWLLKRDAQFRDGRRQEHTAGDKGHLHAKFPYNPNMSHSELAEKNHQLEKFYKNTLYPRQSSEMQTKVAEADKIAVEVAAVAEEDPWALPSAQPKEPSFDHVVSTNLIGDGMYWSFATSIGRWLRWRDRKIRDGVWNPQESLAAALSRLFPRDSSTTIGDMDRMNWELDNFFSGLEYPRASQLTREEMNIAADVIREAMERTEMHRASKLSAAKGDRYGETGSPRAKMATAEQSTLAKDEPLLTTKHPGAVPLDGGPRPQPRSVPEETPKVENQHDQVADRSRFLLDILKCHQNTSDTVRQELDPKDQREVNDRSAQVVQNLSEQISKPTLPNSPEFIRARRMEFFGGNCEKPNKAASENSALGSQGTEVSEQKSSLMEGSWNQSLSCASDRLAPLNQMNLTDLQKALESCSRATGSGEQQEISDTLNDLGSTISYPEEVIPNSLKPRTWRQRNRWSDMFEDPRVIPIPRTLDYDFDPAHLRDLGNILKGGNGCAREGQNAFRMECGRRGYSWGGGGAMAQRFVPRVSTSPIRHNEQQRGDDSARTWDALVLAHLGELPGVMDD